MVRLRARSEGAGSQRRFVAEVAAHNDQRQHLVLSRFVSVETPNHLPARHVHELVGEFEDVGEIVADDQDGDALAA